ncbi:hypothetical protein GCM10027073_11150 [Streptomyces chlorus]
MRGELAEEAENLRRALKEPAEDIGGDKVGGRTPEPGIRSRPDGIGSRANRWASCCRSLTRPSAAIRGEPEKVTAPETRSHHNGA